jgi:hypothetical protein
LKPPELDQELFVTRAIAMCLQPVKCLLNEGEERAGSVVDVTDGDAKAHASSFLVEQTHAGLERTFLG